MTVVQLANDPNFLAAILKANERFQHRYPNPMIDEGLVRRMYGKHFSKGLTLDDIRHVWSLNGVPIWSVMEDALRLLRWVSPMPGSFFFWRLK